MASVEIMHCYDGFLSKDVLREVLSGGGEACRHRDIHGVNGG